MFIRIFFNFLMYIRFMKTYLSTFASILFVRADLEGLWLSHINISRHIAARLLDVHLTQLSWPVSTPPLIIANAKPNYQLLSSQWWRQHVCCLFNQMFAMRNLDSAAEIWSIWYNPLFAHAQRAKYSSWIGNSS